MTLNQITQEILQNLKALTDEVGCYAISSWRFEEKLWCHCDTEKLDEWMKKKQLEYNYVSEARARIGYETEDYVFYAFLD